MIGYKTIEEFTLKECDAYLKRTDISEEDRQRTAQRKAYLSSLKPELVSELETNNESETNVPQKTIMELFPKYKFMPTSLRKYRGYAHLADYVCTNIVENTFQYVVFVKDRKFGICNYPKLFLKAKVMVPPIYDKLSWKKRNKILYAIKDGKEWLIDVYGNKLN